MYRAATGRVRRAVGGGFEEVPQIDADGEQRHSAHERQTSEHLPYHLQDISRQASQLQWDSEKQSIHGSPALSDTTSLSSDYLEVDSPDYHEEDIANFAEYRAEFYGPQPVNLSPTKSLKAGLGIEVQPKQTRFAVEVDGLYLDDPVDTRYRGSEGNVEAHVPTPSEYKPVVLRKRFLVALIAALLILLAMTELTIQLVRKGSDEINQEGVANSSEVGLRIRATEYNSGAGKDKEDEVLGGTDGQGGAAHQGTTHIEDPPGLTSPAATKTGGEDVAVSPTKAITLAPVKGDPLSPPGESPGVNPQPNVPISVETSIAIPPTSSPTTPEIESPTLQVPSPPTTTKLVNPETPIPVPITSETQKTSYTNDPTRDTKASDPVTGKPLSPSPEIPVLPLTTDTPSHQSQPQPSTSTKTTKTVHDTGNGAASPTVLPSEENKPTDKNKDEKPIVSPITVPIDDFFTIKIISTQVTSPGDIRTAAPNKTPPPPSPPLPPSTPPPAQPPGDTNQSDPEKPNPQEEPQAQGKPNLPGVEKNPPGPKPSPEASRPEGTEVPVVGQPPVGAIPTPPEKNVPEPKPENTLPVEQPTENGALGLGVAVSPTTGAKKPPPDQPPLEGPSPVEVAPENPSPAPINPPPTHPTAGQENAPPATDAPQSPPAVPSPPSSPSPSPPQSPAPPSPPLPEETSPEKPSPEKPSPEEPPEPSPNAEQPGTQPSARPPSQPTDVQPAPHLANQKGSSKTTTEIPTHDGEEPEANIHDTDDPSLIMISGNSRPETIIAKPASLTGGVTTAPKPIPPHITSAAIETTAVQDEHQDLFSGLEAFTTFVITDEPQGPATDQDGMAAVGTESVDASATDEIHFGHKMLEAALTFYTPTFRDGHTEDAFWAYRDIVTTVLTGADGRPTKTETRAVLYASQKSVLTDYQGRPTGTLTYYFVPVETTLYDKDGRPTATGTFSVMQMPVVSTLFNANGVPTKTTTDFVPVPSTTKSVQPAAPTSTVDHGNDAKESLSHISDAQYFAALMLPTLFAIALAIPIRILDRTVRFYQPFHAMTSEGGVPASQSLCLATTGPRSFLNGFRSAAHGQVILGLTGTLALASAVLIPLSGEIMHFDVENPLCEKMGVKDATGSDECSVTLTVLPHTARAVIGILALMSILACVSILVLRHWRTGVRGPWSLEMMANLATNSDIQRLLLPLRERRNGRTITAESTARAFRGISFELNTWRENAETKYGILISNEIELARERKTVTFGIKRRGARKMAKTNGKTMPFYLLTFAGRIALLSSICIVLALVLVYHITGRGRKGILMDGESFGVRILFTFLGVFVAFTWDWFFYCEFDTLTIPDRALKGLSLTDW